MTKAKQATKKALQTNHNLQKNYRFQTENVTLSFTLSYDKQGDIKAFLRLINQAEKELLQDLENIKNKKL